MAEELSVERDGPTTRLVLNRPEKANALSAALVEALLSEVAAAHDDGTRLLVLEGSGNRFSSGFDLSGLKDQSEGDLALRFIRIETLLQAVYHAPFDTMALAHGEVLGAGADLVGVCKRRVAAPGSSFRMPGLRFGLVLGTRKVAGRIGADAAHTILGENRSFDAEEAHRLGFLTGIAEKSAWPRCVAEAREAAQVLTPEAAAALFHVTAEDTREQDMYALVKSVSRPGLKQRLLDYLPSIKKPR